MNKDLNILKTSFIAHRGMHNINIPENSIKAFNNAIKKGYVIELDVHLLKSGEIVVFHDLNLKRMTNINKNIEECTYEEIKKLKLLNSTQSIPLLENVLKIINGKVPLIIEIKNEKYNFKLERKLCEILKSYKGDYAIQSFNPLSIYYFKKKYPHIIRGQLVSNNHKINKLKNFILKNMYFNIITKPDFISCDKKLIKSKRIKKIRKKKLILSWTIRSKKDLNYAKKYSDNYICENIL